MDNAMHWDLRRMFPTDEAWHAKLQQMLALADELAAQKGHAAASAEELCKTAALYEKMEEGFDDLGVFSNSNFDQDMSDTAAKELNETFRNAATGVGEKLSFLAPELMQYSQEDYDRYCAEKPELKRYASFAEDFFARKEHILPDEQETLMVRMNDIGGSFVRVYEDLMVNDVEYPVVKAPDGSDFEANEAKYGGALTSPDREFSAAYFKALLGTD